MGNLRTVVMFLVSVWERENTYWGNDPRSKESTVHGMQTSAHWHPEPPVTFMSQGFQGYVRAKPDLRRPAVVWSVAESAPSFKETWRRGVGGRPVCLRVVFPIWACVPAGLGSVLSYQKQSPWVIALPTGT